MSNHVFPELDELGLVPIKPATAYLNSSSSLNSLRILDFSSFTEAGMFRP
jgi:hypothetical protein